MYQVMLYTKDLVKALDPTWGYELESWCHGTRLDFVSVLLSALGLQFNHLIIKLLKTSESPDIIVESKTSYLYITHLNRSRGPKGHQATSRSELSLVE